MRPEGDDVGSSKTYKRKYQRIRTPFFVTLLTYNHNRLDAEHGTTAEGVNISPNGLSFKYPKVIEKNDHLRVLIHGIGERISDWSVGERVGDQLSMDNKCHTE